MQATTTYREWTALVPAHRRARSWVRDRVIQGLSLGRSIDSSRGWIRFPYYHHVFRDERAGFASQLDYLKGFGEFLSLDDATNLLASQQPIDGRYFCITFDDGLKSCATGALPILAERDIPAAFYVVSDMVGKSFTADDPVARQVFGFQGRDSGLEFMDWHDCRAMVAAGMTIASHGRSHTRLAQLDAARASAELSISQEKIEAETGAQCRHFCAPYGMPDTDFLPARDPELARVAAYRSFATGRRGANRQGDNPYFLYRDQLLAGWGNYQLDYFLSRP